VGLKASRRPAFNYDKGRSLCRTRELLSIIAPKNEKFYAKISLPEKDLTYIKTNQTVNLKIDAYNYYKFGAIKGNITYISPSVLVLKSLFL
jgi:multidrug resistance efflux pump